MSVSDFGWYKRESVAIWTSEDDHQAWLTRTEAHRFRRQQATEKRVNHRPETLEKEEVVERYGKWDPKKGTCPKCFMILCANGACSGGCDI